MTDRANTGRFKPGQSGNPAGRKPELAVVRQLLLPHRKDLVEKVLAMAKAGNETALRIVFDRIAPLPRAQFEAVEIPGINADASMSDNARAIVRAVGSGLISPDAGALVLGALADARRVIDDDEAEKRLKNLEGGR